MSVDFATELRSIEHILKGGATTVKKCQQYELYAAEGAAPTGRRFDSLEDIQVFVDQLRDTWWWRSLGYWIVERVEVGKARNGGRGGSVGWYEKEMNAGRMEMAPVHWTELIVLHELSHVLAEALYDSKSHDPAFARTYLQLVFCVMGDEAYQALQSSFDRNGIVYDFKTLPESRFALHTTKEN